MIQTKESPEEIIKRLGLVQVSDPALLEKVIDEILTKQKTRSKTIRAERHRCSVILSERP